MTEPMMDRPAYELVRLIEAWLDDADQVTDTPQRPNNIAVWGVRMLLEPYGGKPHRWQWPLCFECKHQIPLHNYGPCDLCGCAITPEEIADGARDEALDEAVEQALRDDVENRDVPPGEHSDTHPTPPAFCLCGVVDDRGDGTCGNCGLRIMTDEDECRPIPPDAHVCCIHTAHCYAGTLCPECVLPPGPPTSPTVATEGDGVTAPDSTPTEREVRLRRCGPCERGQHGCCDHGDYLRCDCECRTPTEREAGDVGEVGLTEAEMRLLDSPLQGFGASLCGPEPVYRAVERILARREQAARAEAAHQALAEHGWDGWRGGWLLLHDAAIREQAKAEALREAADEAAKRAERLRRQASVMDLDGMPSAAAVDRLNALGADEVAEWLRERADRNGGDQ